MRRIRIAFGLLAALLFVPLGLMFQSALESVDAERADRHRAVAERAFDEMERELSRLVRREEERPFGHYDFYYVPDAVSPGRPAVARSPLSSLPEERFVLGYFQIDPDGTLHSPLVPRESVLAKAFGDWTYSAEIDQAVKKVEAIVGASLPPPRGGPALKKERAEFAQAPGTTRVLDRNEGVPRPEGGAEQSDAAARGDTKVDAFRAIASLNRGTEARGARRSLRFQIVQEGGRSTLKLHTDLDALPAGRLVLGPGLRAIEASLGPYAHPDALVTSYYDVDTALRGEPVERLAVAVFPLVGRVEGDHLLLFRDAYEGPRPFRQGLVLDFAELTRWLDQTVVGESELRDHASRDFFLRTGRPVPRSLPEAYAYVHRFAEPFDDLALRMMLPPLPDVGGTGYLYTIAALLVLAGVAGLVALYHMIAVAVRYAERRSNFAAAVSHELKTPLTAIRMHGEMLREGIVSSEEKRQEYYETITAECERLTRLINNVLEFSRLEQGTREMSLAAGALGPVVAEAVRTLEPHASNAGFRLEVEIDQDLPPVRFERDAVIQVVFNLVDNALKYAKGQARDPVITLQCVRQGGTVLLAVRDRGPGVAPRHLPRLFEAFYRGEDELTRSAQGTGIGLALVKGLAERMGASAVARNRDGGGFEVTLTFPPASAS